MAWNSGTGGLEFSRPDLYAGYAPAFREERQRKKSEEQRAEFAKDLNNLTELLTRRISQYASSQDAGARQMAELYASYLDKLKDDNGRYYAVSDYRKGLIPGLSAPRQAHDAPSLELIYEY